MKKIIQNINLWFTSINFLFFLRFIGPTKPINEIDSIIGLTQLILLIIGAILLYKLEEY